MMLGLVELLRAVKGSATIAVRRVPRRVGLGLLVVAWAVALGAVYTFTADDGSRGSPRSAEEASAHVGPDDVTSTEGTTRGGKGDAPGIPPSTTADGAAAPGSTTATTAGRLTGDLGSPPGRRRETSRSSGDTPPSWADHGDSPGSATTSPSTNPGTTPPGSSTTTPTTTPPGTTPPPGNDGLLGGIFDLLGIDH
jgi:hypothetical protein